MTLPRGLILIGRFQVKSSSIGNNRWKWNDKVERKTTKSIRRNKRELISVAHLCVECSVCSTMKNITKVIAE